jgi:hypothetical protein
MNLGNPDEKMTAEWTVLAHMAVALRKKKRWQEGLSRRAAKNCPSLTIAQVDAAIDSLCDANRDVRLERVAKGKQRYRIPLPVLDELIDSRDAARVFMACVQVAADTGWFNVDQAMDTYAILWEANNSKREFLKKEFEDQFQRLKGKAYLDYEGNKLPETARADPDSWQAEAGYLWVLVLFRIDNDGVFVRDRSAESRLLAARDALDHTQST